MILGSPMLGNLHMINPLLPWNSTMLYPYLFLPPTAQVATGVKAPALSPWLLPSAPLWYAAVSADARASAGLFSKTVDGIEGFTWSWSQWYIIDTKYRHRCREYWNPPHPPCHSPCCPLLSLVVPCQSQDQGLLLRRSNPPLQFSRTALCLGGHGLNMVQQELTSDFTATTCCKQIYTNIR